VAIGLVAAALLAAPGLSPAAGIRRFVDAEGTIHLVSVRDEVVEARPAPAPAAIRSPAPPPGAGRYARAIAEAAARYGVAPLLIASIIRVESNFDHRAVSPKGAMGLMQLMPETARMLGVRDAFDPVQNIDAGARHLRGLLERLGGDLPLVLAAYNAGEGAVQAHGGVPPYPESRQYVTRILQLLEAAGPGDEKDDEKEEDIRVAQSERLYTLPTADGTVVWTNIPPRARR
jgi:soluble lytic murein transglycosylase-like protein